MSTFYPFNPNMGQRLQGDGTGVVDDMAFLAHRQIAAADATVEAVADIHAAITLGDGVTTVVTTVITNPTVPRCLLVKGNAAGIAGDVVIVGTDEAGAALTETIIAADATIVRGAKAFATVTSITVPARNAGGDTISVGSTEILGLGHKLTHNTVLKAYHNNTVEAVAPAVTVSATVLAGNTVDLNTALNSSVVDIYTMV